MKYITSRTNASVKQAVALHNKKGREKYDAFLIEGFILIQEAVRSGLVIECLFLRGESPEDEALRLVRGLPYDVDIIRLTESIFDEVADTITPQGVLAEVKLPTKTESLAALTCTYDHALVRAPSTPAFPADRVSEDAIADGKTAYPMQDSLLVLDRIQDPGNVGTLVRTAYAAGVGTIAMVKGTADPWSLKAIRSSAGALFRLPLLTYTDADEAIRELYEAEYEILVLSAEGGCAYYGQDMTGRVALVVGNEGGGVCEEFLAAADGIVSIPMRDGSESLNAATAAGIVMYERHRQMHSGAMSSATTA